MPDRVHKLPPVASSLLILSTRFHHCKTLYLSPFQERVFVTEQNFQIPKHSTANIALWIWKNDIITSMYFPENVNEFTLYYEILHAIIKYMIYFRGFDPKLTFGVNVLFSTSFGDCTHSLRIKITLFGWSSTYF